MEQRVSVITLGVAGVGRAQAFYEKLGWQLDAGVDDETDHIAFFETGGVIVSLWDRDRLARDGGVHDQGSWAGVTLGYCVTSRAEVERIVADARSAGAIVTRQSAMTFWGGYSGFSSTRRAPVGGLAQSPLDGACGCR